MSSIQGTVAGDDGVVNPALTGTAGVDIKHGLGGNDGLIGDVLDGGAGADFLTGGAGHDTFTGTAAGLNGETITDLTYGDKIIISDADVSTFTFQMVGNALNYTGGTLNLSNFPEGSLVASAAVGGGVQLTIAYPNAVSPTGDFNADVGSDLLWRDASGTLSEWLGQPGGGFQWNASASFTVPLDWRIKGFGDFDGDGRTDILWRQDGTGLAMEWLSTGNSFAWRANYEVPTGYQFVGTGDFNGDGRADVMWRNGDGTLSEWLSQADGSFQWNPLGAFQVGNDWQVIGVGDINSDGRSDLVWRQAGSGIVMDWLANAQGGFAWAHNYNAPPELNMQVIAIADFSQDSYGDLVWEDSSGTVSEWLGGGGGFLQLFTRARFGGSDHVSVPPGSNLVAVMHADLVGTSQPSIMVWESDGNQLSFLGGADPGGFVSGDPHYNMDPGIHAQPEHASFF